MDFAVEESNGCPMLSKNFQIYFFGKRSTDYNFLATKANRSFFKAPPTSGIDLGFLRTDPATIFSDLETSLTRKLSKFYPIKLFEKKEKKVLLLKK